MQLLFHLLKNYHHLKITSLSFPSPLFPHPKYLNPLDHNNHTADWQDLPAILGTWRDLFLLWQHRQILPPLLHALSWSTPSTPTKEPEFSQVGREGLEGLCSPQCLPAVPLPRWSPAEIRSWSVGRSSAPVETQRDLSSSVSKADKPRVRTEIFQVLSHPKNAQFVPGMTLTPLPLLFTSSDCGQEQESILQHQKQLQEHSQEHSCCGYGLDKTQRARPPSKWDKTSSQKEQRDLFAVESLGLTPWTCPWKLEL